MSEREDTPLLERAGLVLALTMPLLAWGLQTLAWDWISPSAFLLFYPAVFAAGWLGGIGFTMAVFIAGLAFADAALLATAKVAILCASTLAGVVGFTLVRRAGGSGTIAADPAEADPTAP